MKRASKSIKSRQGCARCKTKRIKCDEARPACRACLRASVECPGYALQYKWSRKHERLAEGSNGLNESSAEERVQNEEEAATGQNDAAIDQSAFSNPPPPADSQPRDFTAETEHGKSPEPLPSWNNDLPTGADFTDLWPLGMPYQDDISFNGLAMMNQHPPAMSSFGPQPSSYPFSSLDELFQNPAPPNANPMQSFEWPLRYGKRSREGTDSPRRKENAPGTGSLLGTYYRLFTPTPIARYSEEHLVQHYFRAVCSLFSCFDSDLNPFRVLVKDLRPTSQTIHLAVQSMAIAHLANFYLYMAPLGAVKHSQAWRSLQLDLQLHRAGKLPLETVLVSLLLLGLSSTWHQPSSLGLQYLSVARNLMQTYLQSTCGPQSAQPLQHEKFLLDALMYWEMLASFVDPVPMTPFPGYGTPSVNLPSEKEPELPHSWTGVSTEIHFALGEVGRILRRRRCLTAMSLGNLQGDISVDEQWSASLEQFISSIVIPGPDAILDYGDHHTPKRDLIRAADAYRYIGLLEIYMIFPRLLEDKVAAGGRFPSCHDRSFLLPIDNSHYREALNSWSCAMASFTLELIRDMPLSSGACRLQPLILISCASQLRLPDQESAPETPPEETRHEEVVDLRSFVESRMLALSRRYPQRQLLRMLEIIKEVWQRLDDEKENAHWLDVAHEKRLQTMMG